MALTAVTGLDTSAMRWLRTQDRPDAFALLAGDQTVATLTWRTHGGSLAAAETAGDSWTLKRAGFLNPLVTVRHGSDTVARLTVHLNHHEIAVAGGASYRFHRAGVLIPAWQVTRSDGAEVLHIEPVREGRRLTAGAVVVGPEARSLPDLLVLCSLAWYFIVLAWFEDETVGPLAPLL